MSKLVVLNHKRCDVCGQAINFKQLRRWNERDVCVTCIQDLTREELE